MKQIFVLIPIASIVIGCSSLSDKAVTTDKWSPPDYRDNSPGFVLDKYIGARIVAPKHVTRIASIHSMSYSRFRPIYQPVEKQTGYDVLLISLSIAGDFGFEGVWHGNLIARKKHTDRGWKNCEVFYTIDDTPPSHLAGMTDVEMKKHLTPYCGEQSSGGNAEIAPSQK